MLRIDELSPEMSIVQSSGMITSDMNGETVMLSIENGKYYNLGNVGGCIWKLIQQPTSINKLISVLAEEFNVDTYQCRADLIPFLNILFKENLIKVEQK
ncbi:lasso peptide biosynthesis PqqD family chaperone [Bacillus sp. ISL-41]|uniref:lasso peptide biosynthesis PqqD family chaperone n=1 Tax=Bacillus sp. ISL-41 TaxID=2819127 RepID=UPI001BEC5204|nr:lasso peptide biosynthesis PqqD family chaperone [Bacillus sp. ISL-41]MBT2642182.1 lasso peptide biosynthesis PqqD family chaperone [Bacillus sp. ISL-41]